MSEYEREMFEELRRSVRTLAILLLPLARGRKVAGRVAGSRTEFKWVEGAIVGVRNGNVLVKQGLEEAVEVSVEDFCVRD